jgi:NitT/TauT family transport system substrate-binding protein
MSAVLIAGLLVPACTRGSDSSGQEPIRVRFRLDWSVNALHAPFFVAAEKGYYRNAGLEVHFLEGRVKREKQSFALRSLSTRGSEQAVSSVAKGEDDLAYAAGDAVIEGVLAGLPVRMVAILLDRSPDGIIVDAAGPIDSIDGLEGHRVALPPEPAWVIRIEQVLAANGVDLDKVQFVPMKVAQQVPAFVSKRVQAILGYPHVFAHRVDDFGLDQLTFRLHDLGLPLVGRGVVASDRFMNEQPDAVRRFIDATARGFQFTQRHPEQAMRTLTDRFQQISYRPGLEHLKAMLRWIEDPPNRPYAYIERAPWVLTEKLLLESDHIDALRPVRAFYTNRFVQ